MRPVSKKKPGDEVEFITSMNRKIIHTIKEDYDPYGTAKAPLIANLGSSQYEQNEPKLAIRGALAVPYGSSKQLYTTLNNTKQH